MFQQAEDFTAFTNTDAAALGLLAMFAMDMNRPTTTVLTPLAVPGLEQAGWSITAYIVGKDTLMPDPKAPPLRGPLQLLDQLVNYGFLARNPSGAMVAVIRGTDGFVEWVEDGQFVPVPYMPDRPVPPSAGSVSVEQGFWTLYQSMTLVTEAGASLGKLAPAITKAVGGGEMLTVIGHSLGAALATYLTLDLARGGVPAVKACLFASPHPGDAAFATLFDQTVQEYRLFNYILDIVPRVPLWLGYAPLPQRTVLQPSTAEASIRMEIACNHHVICYCAMLDYAATMAATTPVPDGEQASAACILGPETGAPSLAKQLVSDLARLIPV